MSPNPPDLDLLLERCKRWYDEPTDESAWVELFHRFDEPLRRWLARLNFAAREEDIADLRQEAFRKLTQSLPNYRREVPFKCWLFKQVESVAIDDLRRRTAAKRIATGLIESLHKDELDDAPGIDLADARPHPDELAASRDEHRLLFQALDGLGPPDCRCRQLINFCYFGGFKYEEVAAAMGMNPKTVSSALSKCLAQLRELAAGVFSGSKTAPPATGS